MITTANAPYPLESYLGDDPDREEYLPESDGKPMAETDTHRRYMLDVLDALDEHYRDDPWTYVTGNIFLYYPDETGKLHAVSPDIFVVHGVEKKDRRIYNLKVENKAPEVVIELTSPSTKMEDLGNKRFLYASLGVKEYFLFDPFGEAVRPLLRGFRLEDGDYMPIVGTRLHSKVLGLELRLEEGTLRLYNPQTREYLLTREETHQARRAAEAARKAAETARHAAETAQQAAETKAAREEAARRAAEAELARLREELAKSREQKN